MSNYPAIKNILESIFSVDVGLDEGDAQEALGRVLSDSYQRGLIENEIRQLFQDDTVSWMTLLDNNDYVIYPADDEVDARNYFVKIIWNKVFPEKPVPFS